MIKLLFGRLLPGALAAGLVTSAISPIAPALDAFAVAANALTGDPEAGGVDMPTEEQLMANVPNPDSVNPSGILAKLFGKKTAKTDHASQEIAGLAEKMKARADARAAENKAKMGPKDGPPEPAPKPKKKQAAKPKAEPEPVEVGTELGDSKEPATQ